MSDDDKFESSSLPPTAPPLLPSTPWRPEPQGKLSIPLKVRAATPGWAFGGNVTSSKRKHVTPPAGTYFFHGTLQDLDLLQDILDPHPEPLLRPARIYGYKLRLCGHYPAMVDEAGISIKGVAFDVSDKASAEKLAAYETNSYQPAPCLIQIGENEQDAEPAHGFVFKYCGNPVDLSDGVFDLDSWWDKFRRKSTKGT